MEQAARPAADRSDLFPPRASNNCVDALPIVSDEDTDVCALELEKSLPSSETTPRSSVDGSVDEKAEVSSLELGDEERTDVYRIAGAIELYRISDRLARASVTRTLTKLSRDDDVDDLINMASGISSLATLLCNNDNDNDNNDNEANAAGIAIDVLCELAEDSEYASLAASSRTFTPVVDKLRNGHQSDKEQAAVSIMRLSRVPTLRTLLVRAGAVPPLLNLFQDQDDGQQRRATAALWNLVQTESGKSLIVSSGVFCQITQVLQLMIEDGDIADTVDIISSVPMMFELIRENDDAVGDSIMDLMMALIKLRGDPDYQKGFKDARGIPSLVEVIGCGHGAARRKAVDVLELLAVQTSDRPSILSAGGLRALLAMAQSECQEDAIRVGSALTNIDWTDGQCGLPVSAADMEALVTVTSDGNDENKLMAMTVLSKLLLKEKPNKRLVAEAQGVPVLIKIARDDRGLHRFAAVKLLKSLALDEDNEKVIATEGGIPVLVDFLRDGSTAEEKLEGTLAVQNVSIVPENKVMIAAAGAIECLIPLMEDSNWRQRYAATCTLFNIAGNADNRKTVIALGVVPKLASCYSCDKTRAKALSLLKRLAKDDGLGALVVANGALEPLVELIKNARSDVMALALEPLELLAVHSENKPLIASAGAVPVLIGIVGDSDLATEKRKKAANVLEALMEDVNTKATIEANGWKEALGKLQSDPKFADSSNY